MKGPCSYGIPCAPTARPGFHPPCAGLTRASMPGAPFAGTGFGSSLTVPAQNMSCIPVLFLNY